VHWGAKTQNITQTGQLLQLPVLAEALMLELGKQIGPATGARRDL
jgi:hypothetical protein